MQVSGAFEPGEKRNYAVDQPMQQPICDVKLADAALRNLHLDCSFQSDDGKQFSSRILHLSGEALVIEAPQRQGCPVELSPGETVVCSCRLGHEILRFPATVAGRTSYPPGSDAPASAVRLERLGQLTVVHRRRYYRVALGEHRPTEVMCWVVQLGQSGAVSVCSKFAGEMADLSQGGIGVVVKDKELLSDREGRQLWVRFTLPGENESLIFRVELRHVESLEEEGTYRIGLKFMHYVDPGQHERIVERLACFTTLSNRPAQLDDDDG